MTTHTSHRAAGTSVTYDLPFGLYRHAYLLCPDGRVRKTKRMAHTPDTFYSVPCTIVYKGKSIAGFMNSSPDEVLEFVPYWNRKNGYLFFASRILADNQQEA